LHKSTNRNELAPILERIGGHVRRLAFNLLLVIVASVAARSAIANPVTWVFTETSCSANPGGGCLSPLPQTIGYLSLPDINFTGSYSLHFTCGLGGCTPTETFSGGFALVLGNGFPPPPPMPLSPWPGSIPIGSTTCFFANCSSVDFNFTSSAANGLTFSLSDTIFTSANEFISISGSGGAFAGRSGSDAGIPPGCFEFSLCQVSGTVSLVPEPSSLSLLISAMLLGLFLVRFRRQ